MADAPDGELKRGDRGDKVRQLQERLNELGHRIDVDGQFGARTESAVRNFQKGAGLPPDGRVGPRTLAALFAAPSQADTELPQSTERIRRTSSVQAVADATGLQTAGEIARSLWAAHPDYPGRELALRVLLDQSLDLPAAGRTWVERVEAALDPSAVRAIPSVEDQVLHGKLLIYGLATLVGELRETMEEAGLLDELRRAITPDPEALFVQRAGATSSEGDSSSSSTPSPPRASPDAKLIADAPAEVDLLDREGFANALSRLIRYQRRPRLPKGVVEGNGTKAKEFGEGPILLQLFGTWGSGKTSVAGFVRKALEQPDEVFGKDERLDPWLFVTFDAWQHQRTAPPWWWLMDRVYRDARDKRRPGGGLPGDRRRAVWWWRWGWAVVGIVLALAVVATGVVLRDAILDQAGRATDAIGAVVGLVTALSGALVLYRGARASLLVGSPRAATALLRSGGDPFRRVHDRFQALVKRIGRPVLVFVDNLDRCQPAYLVELLEGIQTVFADIDVTYLVAADREWVAHSFEEQYKDFKDVMGRPGRPLGYLFLEKTFAVSAPLPRPSEQARARYWDAVLREGTTPVAVTPEQRRQATVKLSGSSLAEVLGAVEQNMADSSAEARALREAAAVKVVEETAAGSQDHELKPYLSLMEPNPRALKRLRNSVSIARAAQVTSGDAVLSPDDLDGLIRWTILMLRWPTLAVVLTEHPDRLAPLVSRKGEGLGALEPIANDDALYRLLTEPVGTCTPDLASWVVATFGVGAPPP